MKKWLPLIITVLFACWVIGQAYPPKEEGIAVQEFGKLPILNG